MGINLPGRGVEEVNWTTNGGTMIMCLVKLSRIAGAGRTPEHPDVSGGLQGGKEGVVENSGDFEGPRECNFIYQDQFLLDY